MGQDGDLPVWPDVAIKIWAQGPAIADGSSGALVSFTQYTADKARDMPGIIRTGLHLRGVAQGLGGCIGLWLYGQPWKRRFGSLSVWSSDDGLREFVIHPEHLPVMRHYRDRGRLRSTSWRTSRESGAAVWTEAGTRFGSRANR
jgi:hypothetical protein